MFTWRVGVLVMGDVIKRDFNKKFMHNQELADKIFAVLDEYDGEISLAETIGVLRLIETILIKTHVELDDGNDFDESA
jgi:hypothetical protein